MALSVMVSWSGNIQLQVIEQALHRDGFDPSFTQNADQVQITGHVLVATYHKGGARAAPSPE